MSLDDAPRMLAAQRLTGAWTALPAVLPIPGLGVLPVNGFLCTGPEPMLVDTGLAALGPGFMAALELAIDPAGLRWIRLSHQDLDHVGNLDAVLERAPRARVPAALSAGSVAAPHADCG